MKLTNFNGNKFPPNSYPIPSHPLPTPHPTTSQPFPHGGGHVATIGKP